MQQDIDILIVGSGLVGAALCVLLRDTGYSVAIVDRMLPNSQIDSQVDHRVYAISPKNRALLTKSGVWSMMDHSRVTPIRQMVISESGQIEKNLVLNALDIERDELATIVENQVLQSALQEKIAAWPDIQFFSPRTIETIQVKTEYVKVSLDNQEVIHARLLIGADGAHSLVRQSMGEKVQRYDYRQRAIVANFHCTKPHQEKAYQWFSPEGVMAWLPLFDQHISIVWSVESTHAAHLLTLSDEAFTRAVMTSGNGILGELTLVNQPSAFPLFLSHVPHWVSPRIALVGDAAHTVHPLAGLGLNLGLDDVAVLASLLRLKGRTDPGKLSLLRQYERSRRAGVYQVQGVTHALKLLFNNRHPILTPLRQLGMRYVDKLGFIKRQLMSIVLK